MSNKTSHRRANGGNREHVSRVIPNTLEMIAWKVTDVNGIENVLFTLTSTPPQGYPDAQRFEA